MIFQGRSILVIGGTGSLGRALVRRILSGEAGIPRKVMVMSRDEAKQYDMRTAYLNRQNCTDEVTYANFQQNLEFRIGDVRSYADVCSALKDAEIVANVAALKQVPVCEYFPGQAVATNCLGAENIVRAIREHDLPVHTVVGISTDKACKPVSAMGMTKALQERIFVSANVLASATRFICVRYGNVIASRGSVIPLFQEQIRSGVPLTLTSPEMTRFLLNLDEAVDTVFQAVREARPGEIYVPRIRAVRIFDLARAMVGDRDLEIRITGLRPGEKLNEVLISDEECRHVSQRGAYYVIHPLLPELRKDDMAEPVLKTEYSSDDHVLDYEGTCSLLKRNGLLPFDADMNEGRQSWL